MSEGSPALDGTDQMEHTHTHTASGSDSRTAHISPDERQQALLDDLRIETRRVADAIERQNELIEQLADDDGVIR